MTSYKIPMTKSKKIVLQLTANSIRITWCKWSSSLIL
jgi:hypothetical protein